MKFEAVVLTEAADFLIREEEDLQREEEGVKLSQPFTIDEEEKSRRTKAEEVFIPYHSILTIQYGEFEYE